MPRPTLWQLTAATDLLAKAGQVERDLVRTKLYLMSCRERDPSCEAQSEEYERTLASVAGRLAPATPPRRRWSRSRGS